MDSWIPVSTGQAALASVSGVMMIFESDTPLEWGALDLPMLGIGCDWHGAPMEPVPGYALACDPGHLWFVAHHRAPARSHPDSRPGLFCADLWVHDVAEFFLLDPASGRYLEFNLAANAAWWSCEFTAARQRADSADVAVPGVRTWADLSPDGAWLAAMAVPLDVLRARIGFGAATRMNVCMILGTPEQRFFSAIPLGLGDPDFHRPESFAEVRFQPLSGLGWGGDPPGL
ncbi:MAG: hypothetical protein ACNA8L_04275 [Luteolibacter sp.]